MSESILLSIVVPVYKEETAVPIFVDKVQAVLNTITDCYEIIFVLDPSPDQTEVVIEKQVQQDSRIKLIKLSRRFGQPKATLAGLHFSVGKAVVVMDVDLQDPPELILEMVKKWQAGFDVVYAKRINRNGESLIKKVISYLGYKFINRIADVEIPVNTGDYRLMSRRVVAAVKELKESHGFLRGMVALVGFSQTEVLFNRPNRQTGESKYNRFFGSIKIGLNGIICFSTYTLSLSTFVGFVIATIAFLLAVAYLLMWFLGFQFPINDPTTLIVVLFLGGVQLISVGILGEYIGRIYEEVRNRPLYIVDRAIGVKDVK